MPALFFRETPHRSTAGAGFAWTGHGQVVADHKLDGATSGDQEER